MKSPGTGGFAEDRCAMAGTTLFTTCVDIIIVIIDHHHLRYLGHHHHLGDHHYCGHHHYHPHHQHHHQQQIFILKIFLDQWCHPVVGRAELEGEDRSLFPSFFFPFCVWKGNSYNRHPDFSLNV